MLPPTFDTGFCNSCLVPFLMAFLRNFPSLFNVRSNRGQACPLSDFNETALSNFILEVDFYFCFLPQY